MIQMQKDVEETASKTSRSAIIQDLINTPILKDVKIEEIIERNVQNGSMVVHYNVLSRMIESAKRSTTKRKEDKTKPTSAVEKSKLPVDALDSLTDDNVLQDSLEADTVETNSESTNAHETENNDDTLVP
ncbi:hypothetical protein DPMN_119222 [Dreissena polymorpha]|uniref:Uncharacterized protein n=1 Tax=Dreissena polymorpha TaxID=45954 RepID=A0A9D4GPI7_DREPO|nr:hypothetical protein DPMN_119222 [Dreissena polymorpha]